MSRANELLEDAVKYYDSAVWYFEHDQIGKAEIRLKLSVAASTIAIALNTRPPKDIDPEEL